VPTGFPQTTQGAIAQLAAIDQAALGSGSIRRAQEVVAAWTTPGGPTAQTWSGVRAVAELLSAAGLPADGQTELAVSVLPAMALIKGQLDVPESGTGSRTTTGTAWYVVPCLDLVVTATVGGPTRRTAVADCQRMTWVEERWVLGPGPEPSPAPSLWPGSAASYAVGYQWLETNPT
jgi:hypothetical protein